jgi:hypothetical protein
LGDDRRLRATGFANDACCLTEVFKANLRRRTRATGRLVLRMLESRAGTFWRAAQQCFFGSIALTIVTIFCFRLGANLPTMAFIYLAFIVLLSLIGS